MKAKDKQFIILVPANAKVKVYLPVEKTKTRKARVRGFWKSESGKVFYDYLRSKTVYRKELRKLRKETGEEALFYTYDGKGYIYSGGESVCLPDCTTFIYIKGVLSIGELKDQIKRLIKTYGGLTVYDNGLCWLVKVYK